MAKKLLLGLVLALAAGFAAYRFGFSGGEDPLAGIARANGRLEFERLDVATLYAGRIERVEVDEGDEVASGAVLARLSRPLPKPRWPKRGRGAASSSRACAAPKRRWRRSASSLKPRRWMPTTPARSIATA